MIQVEQIARGGVKTPDTGGARRQLVLIKLRIKFGGALMPAFRAWLSDRDIDNVIDYIASK